MKKSLLLLVLLFTLSGCIKYVYVPVPCKEPPELQYPQLMTDSLPSGATKEQKAEAIRNDGFVLKTTLRQCVNYLDVYRKK